MPRLGEHRRALERMVTARDLERDELAATLNLARSVARRLDGDPAAPSGLVAQYRLLLAELGRAPAKVDDGDALLAELRAAAPYVPLKSVEG